MSFAVFGSIVLISYCTNPPSNTVSIWAGLNNQWALGVWAVTASSSVIAYMAFSIEILSADENTIADPLYASNWYAYTTFLASAAMYMPLATRGYHVATILVLGITAASTCFMAVFSVGLFGWNITSLLLVVLAFHCTVVDLIYWGGTWWVAETRNYSAEYESPVDGI
jgi:hypothetical protein